VAILYGTASTGGSYLSGCGGAGCGTVFELKHTASGWDQIVLYSFTGGTDGGAPSGSLIFDKAGNLYGTAYEGGELGGSCPGTPGCGVVFELQSVNGHWVEKVLHSFLGGTDSANPSSDLVFDRDGNLYGATQGGGGPAYCYGLGCGTVFELSPIGNSWSYSVRLLKDAAGNFYGTALGGGNDGCIATSPSQGCGVVFKLTPSSGGWTETTLYSFKNDGNDGFWPNGTLVLDAAGNLYGTTFFTSGSNGQWGTIYEIAP
jgi:uncharacterized repeat protein (TIGR03803 family)